MDDNAKYGWPAAEQRSLIGKRISRVDGPDKVSGRAKYTYDLHRPGMLYGKVVRSPHAHAKVTSIDISAAEKMPGVKGVYIIQDKGSEIHWAGDDIVVVAAVDEPTAADAARAWRGSQPCRSGRPRYRPRHRPQRTPAGGPRR